VKRTTPALLIALLTVCIAGPARADDDASSFPRVTLKVGDPAPPLHVGRWLKGEPVKSLQPGKIYVIECWASWCAPCVAAMPHVTKLQARYRDKGVVVIGANVLERDPAAGEQLVKKMGDRIGYAIAADDTAAGAPGKMVNTWLRAAGRPTLPWTFLIDRRGRIAWMGFPMMMDRPLAALAEDRFDPAEQAKFEADLDALFAEYAAASKAKDDDRALRILDRLIAANPAMAPQYATSRLTVLLRKGDYPAANAQARALVGEGAGDDPTLQATIANTLLSAPDPSRIDTAIAVTLAKNAYDAHDATGWDYAALLARAYAADHQYDKAVDLQTRALAQAPESARDRAQQTLAEYQQHLRPGM
jgi:thiol-disulfide isomerase/thioredoxin